MVRKEIVVQWRREIDVWLWEAELASVVWCEHILNYSQEVPKVTKRLLPLNMGCVNGWVVRSEGAVNGDHQCSPVEILAKFSEGIWREAFNCSFPNSVSLESPDFKFLS